MAIIGVASVRVRPDLTKFREELNAGLRKIKAEFDVQVGADTTKAKAEIERMIRRFDGKNINVDPKINTTKIVAAEFSMKKLLSTSGKVGKSFLEGEARVLKFAVAAGSLASTLASIAPIIGGVGQAIAALGGAAVGVGAAGLASLLAVTTTLKLGTAGLGDAFKAVAEGDAAKLAEAMKKLSPAAQDFVTQTSKLKPLLDQLKLDVQTALFRGLGAEVLKTGEALQGVATRQFVGLGRVMNSTAKDVLAFVRSSESIGNLKGIADNITAGFKNATGAAVPLTQAIIDIVRSASELLPGLGQGFADVTKKFAEFIHTAAKNGDLTDFFRQAIDTVKQFGRILRDFGVGISNIFQIGSDSAGGFLDILERAAKAFRNFTESLGGQLVIRQIFDVIGDVSTAFGEMLGALKPLLPLVGKFASILADSLVQILEELGPILLEVGKVLLDTLAEVLPIITPFVIELAKGLGEILKALLPLAVPLAKLLAALTPLIPPIVRLAQAVLPPLAKILEAIAPLIELLAKVLGFLLDAVTFLLTPLGWLADGIAALADAVPRALGNVGKLKQAFMDILGIPTAGFKSKGQDLINAIAEGVDLGKTGLLNAVRNTLIEAVTIFTGQKPTYEREGMSLMESVNAGFKSQEFLLKDQIKQTLNAVLSIFGAQVDDFEFEGANMGKAFSTGFTTEQRKVIEQVRTTIQQMINVLTGKEPDFNREGAAISRQLGAGMASDRTPAQVAADTAGAIGRSFGGVNLFSEGASIMASLRNGLAAGIQAVKNVLTSVTSLIPTWKGPESTDKKLLTPSGIWIMRGLVDGITSQLPELERTLSSVTGQIESAFSPDSNSITARALTSIDLTGGLEPVAVQLDVNLNENGMRDLIDVQIDANNRTITRFSQTGVTR